MAILCAVGDEPAPRSAARDPHPGRRSSGVPLRMVSQAASRRNVTVVLRDSDVAAAMTRLHDAWFAAPAAAVLSRPCRSSGLRVAADGRTRHVWAGSSSRWRRRTGSTSPAASTSTMSTGRDDWPDGRRGDRFLDWRRRCRRTFRRSPRAGSHLVIGTTGWQAQEAALRARGAARGIGVVAAPNFALGVNLFLALAARAAELMARPAGVRRVDARAASRGEAGRTVGDGAGASRRDARGRATRCRSTSRRRGPGRFPARTRSGSTAPARRSR